MANPLIPYARTARFRLMLARARRAAERPLPAGFDPAEHPVSFVVGCGRSGTTILGKVLATHAGVTYFREPYHLWATIDERADVTGLHVVTPRARFFLDAEDRTEGAQRRFDRLIAAGGRPGTRVVEKTPHNAARLGWLDALSPGARFVHIVRNGLGVARSIDDIATHSRYRMAFKPRYNQWWGTDWSKWRALRTEGPERGHFPDEVGLLTTHAQRGAYEWLASLAEVGRQREALGDRLLEVTYTELTADPEPTLRAICAHLGLDCPADWLAAAVAMVRPEAVPTGYRLALPPAMRAAFDREQSARAFAGRAESPG